MSPDQAHSLRQLVRDADADYGRGARGELPLVVFSGGKGGVGASTLAAEIARATAQQGHRVVLVEADLDRGGIFKQSPDGGSIADCITGRYATRDVLEAVEERLWILPGAWAPKELVECTASSQERLIESLHSLADMADVVLVDVGSSRNPFVRRFWRAASMVVVVSSPESESVVDTYSAIKVMLAGDTSMPLYTLVNLADDGVAANLVHERIRITCKRFLGVRTSSLGSVPLLPPAALGAHRDAWHGRVRDEVFGRVAATLCTEMGIQNLGTACRGAA
jgi:flagellar biosynthesis protein FlhG